MQVKIEKLSNLGYGIAKVDGFVYFVENSCPGDVAEIQVIKKNKNFANAKIVNLIEPSPDRVEPFCKMQKVCGACQLQFIDYESQIKYKKEIVSDTMRSIYGYDVDINDVVQSPKIREYRHKIQYPIGQTKESGRILAGYYKPNSHELINIKYCPIQPERCDRIIEFIREEAQKLNISAYKEGKGLLRHVVIRTSDYNSKSLVVLVINSTKIANSITELCNKIYEELENIAGVVVNFNTRKTNLILGEKCVTVAGADFVEEKLCDKIFKISAKTFFQVNPYCADNIFKYVRDKIISKYDKPTILDAYAGISAFGICLSDAASHVVTVEEVADSVNMAKRIIKENNINNVEPYCMDTSEFFERVAAEGKKFDITVLDPPRKGAAKECLDYALKITKKAIVYVSCNPATLARDLKYLKESGANISSVQPFDMFPHTYHVENAVEINL